jgi:hypothetical protein
MLILIIFTKILIMKKAILILISILSINLFSQKDQSLKSINEIDNNNIDFINKHNTKNELKSNNKNLKTNKAYTLVQKLDSVKYWGFNFGTNQFTDNMWRLSNYSYDINNNLTGFYQYVWNGTNYALSSRWISTYDANNNKLSDLTQLWNSTALIWENFGRDTYKYDVNNNRVSYLHQLWNSTALIWKNDEKDSTTYDVNNNRITYLKPNWNTTTLAWENSEKDSTIYDVNNNKTLRLHYTWHTTTSAWFNGRKTVYVYDANNNNISDTLIDYINSIWRNHFFYTYTYDNNNNQTSSTLQSAINLGNLRRDIYTYDASNNQKSYLQQRWNTVTSAWFNDNNYFINYDANNFILNTRHYYHINGVLHSGDSSYYYYQPVVGLNELIGKDKSIIVYPNPSKGILNISSSNIINSIEMYNNIGVLVSKPEIMYNNQIDLSSLSKGMYFLKVSSGKQYHTEKVIIE